MIKVEVGSAWYALPESWPEVIVSGKYLDVIAILSHIPDGPFKQQRSAELFIRLYSKDAMRKARLPKKVRVPAAMKMVDTLFPLLSYLTEPLASNGRVQVLIDNPLPEFTHDKILYKGKGQRLQPQTGQEMEESSWVYSEYMKSGQMELLDRLIATLYTPSNLKDYTEEQRKDFAWSKALTTMHPLVKMGIRFWYESCETWWMQTYKHLYEKDGDGPKDSLGVSRLLRAVAGQKYGTVNDVRKLSRGEIYFVLSELHREYEESKK